MNLRRTLERLLSLPQRVDELATNVAGMGGLVSQLNYKLSLPPAAWCNAILFGQQIPNPHRVKEPADRGFDRVVFDDPTPPQKPVPYYASGGHWLLPGGSTTIEITIDVPTRLLFIATEGPGYVGSLFAGARLLHHGAGARCVPVDFVVLPGSQVRVLVQREE